MGRVANGGLCILSLSQLGIWFVRQVFVVAHEVVVSQAFVVAPFLVGEFGNLIQ